MTQTLMQQAIEAIHRGDKPAGQRLLAQVLRADPRNETAWLWMSEIVETDAQRLDCLRRILSINPNNRAAHQGVELLEARLHVSPPPAHPLTRISLQAEPPPPPPAPTHVSPFPDAPQAEEESALTNLVWPASQERPAETVMPAPAPAGTTLPVSAPADQRAAEAKRPKRRERESPQRAQPRPIALILLAVLLVVGGGGAILAIISSRPAQPVATPVKAAGRLAVSLAAGDSKTGGSEIDLIRSDGTGLVKLVQRPGRNLRPAWSPDGKRIAFAAEYSGTLEIAIVDANGQGLTRLTQSAGHADSSVDPAWSPDGKRIAFASDREGDFDIFVMGMDGSSAFNLTRFEGDDRAPAWTPDGKSIVFQSDREGQINLYRMDADGSFATRLTRDQGSDTDPAVSPDGRRIAYVSKRSGKSGLYVMSMDGSDQRAVTDNTVDAGAPVWTADGSILFTSVLTDGAALYTLHLDGTGLTRIAGDLAGVSSAVWQPVDVDPAAIAARPVVTPTVPAPLRLPEGAIVFASNREGQLDLYTMNLDGKNLKRLISTPGDKVHPSTSPANARIAFEAPLSTTRQIFTFDISSSTVFTLTKGETSARRPVWSPDGTKIAYEVDGERGPNIAVMNPDGSGATRLTKRLGYDGCLSWRPDGKQIAFTSDRDGGLDIYVMNVDGSNVQRLTRYSAANRCPAWRPDGQAIAFLSDRNGPGVYLMEADGSNARLVVAVENASQPQWSPDGKWLLVSSDQDGRSHIYLIAADGTALVSLTADSNADDFDPVWKP